MPKMIKQNENLNKSTDDHTKNQICVFHIKQENNHNISVNIFIQLQCYQDDSAMAIPL